MIFHTGDVRRNCIKIQLAELPTGLSRYRQTGPHFGPPLPSPLKGERQFDCLLNKLIDKDLYNFRELVQSYVLQNSQDADKPVLPASGGDRGGR